MLSALLYIFNRANDKVEVAEHLLVGELSCLIYPALRDEKMILEVEDRIQHLGVVHGLYLVLRVVQGVLINHLVCDC